jgi:2,3-bisphosphoglycerate-dependent phosphoglycerate mutase
MTAKRVLPFYDRAIAGDLRLGKNVLVVAHGNSNRSVVMKLDKLTGEQVVGLELATGVPLIYELTTECEVKSKRETSH